MSDRDNLPIDPPDNQGGGNVSTSTESTSSSSDAAPIDPPENQGGGSSS
jgi:hypothetical protein